MIYPTLCRSKLISGRNGGSNTKKMFAKVDSRHVG